MRKHFLLLFLMALLPLAGWAADYANVAVTLSATQADYSGNAVTLATLITSVNDGNNEVPAAAYTAVWKNSANETVETATNAGTYTLTITATEGNAITMASQDAITYVINKVNAAITVAPARAADQLTYTGDLQALITAGTVTGGSFRYAVTTTNSAPATDAAATWYEDAASVSLKRSAAGTYYLWYKVEGDGNHNGVNPTAFTTNASIEIVKSTITVTTPAAELNANVNWDGNLKQVIKTGVTATGKGDLTKYYAVTTSSTAPGAEVADVWFTDITDEHLRVSAANTYYAYYKIESNDVNVEKLAPTAIAGTFVINAVPATITTAPTAKNLTYNAEAQELVEAGAAVGGEMQYSLTNNGNDWSADIPTATNYAADGYKVYYRVKGDGNHTDYQPMTEGQNPQAVSITVNIAKKNLKVKPKAITSFFGGVTNDIAQIELEYDGFVGNDWYEDDNISNPAKVSVFDNVNYFAPTKAFAGTTTTTIGNNTYINVIDNANALCAVNGANAASALNYNIILQKNRLKIEKAKIKLELKKAPAAAAVGTAAAEKPSWTFAYDESNTWLKVEVQTNVDGQGNPEYTVATQHANPTTDAQILENQIYSNLDKYMTKYNYGTNNNPAYRLKGVSISRANTSTDAGKYDLTLNVAEDTETANTDIIATTIGDDPNSTTTPKEKLKFVINPAVITITPDNTWKVYGDPDPTSWEVSAVITNTTTAYNLNDAQKAAIAAVIARAQAGTTAGEQVGDYVITIPASVKQNAAFNNCTVTLNTGWFTIEKRALVIDAADQTLYVGNTIAKLDKAEGTGYTVTGLQTIGGVADVATVDLKFSAGVTLNTNEGHEGELVAQNAVVDGIEIDLKNQAALSANYDITLNHGKLTVNDPTLGIELKYTADNTDLIQAANGKTVAVTFGTRALKAGYWYTMVLPFDIRTADLVAALKAKDAATTQNPTPTTYHTVYAIVNRFSTASTTDHIQFKLEMSSIPANEPFMIKTAEDINLKDAEFGNKLIVYSATPVITDAAGSNAGNEFRGVYATTSIQAAAPFVPAWYDSENSAADPDGPKWRVPGNAAKDVAPMEAYLVYSPDKDWSNKAPLITFEDLNENGTTSIVTFNAESKSFVNVDGWYTLNGVKLQGAPTEKGIYINNGKKIVIK